MNIPDHHGNWSPIFEILVQQCTGSLQLLGPADTQSAKKAIEFSVNFLNFLAGFTRRIPFVIDASTMGNGVTDPNKYEKANTT